MQKRMPGTFLMLAVLSLAAVVLHAQQAKADEPMSYRDLVEMIRLERSRLLSGNVQITGAMTPHGSKDGIPHPVEATLEFAAPEGKVRFDIRRSLNVRQEGAMRSVTNRRIIGIHPDKAVHFNDFNQTFIWIGPRTFSPANFDALKGFWDPRCFGLQWPKDVQAWDSLDKYADRELQRREEPRVTVTGNEVMVEKLGPLGRSGKLVRSRQWFDLSQGAALVRGVADQGRFLEDGSFEPLSVMIAKDNTAVIQEIPADLRALLALQPDVIGEIQLDWQEIDSIHVPTRYQHRMLSFSSPRPQMVELDFELHWRSINHGVSDDRFDLDSFDLPAGTVIWDGFKRGSSGSARVAGRVQN